MQTVPSTAMADSVVRPAISSPSSFEEAGTFSYPNYTIAGTHLLTPPSPDGREFKLLIGLPYHYHDDPRRKFPVLYLCDGYWDFMVILGLYGPLYSDRAIEEFIIVGLAYGDGYPNDPGIKDRTSDLIPTGAETLTGPANTSCTRYLEHVTGVFAPLVERKFRADPSQRVIAGTSIGGTFALLSLLRKPGFFSGAIVLSPCLNLGNSVVGRLEKEYFQRNRSRRCFEFLGPRPALPVRLFMAVGSADAAKIRLSTKALDRHLGRRRYSGLERQFLVPADETHATVKAEGFNRGLKYVFGPRTPKNKPEGKAG